jgi:hypothetical protein
MVCVCVWMFGLVLIWPTACINPSSRDLVDVLATWLGHLFALGPEEKGFTLKPRKLAPSESKIRSSPRQKIPRKKLITTPPDVTASRKPLLLFRGIW